MTSSAASLRCSEADYLTEQEKAVFAGYLAEQGLAFNLWDFFTDLVHLGTAGEGFFFLKVMAGEQLVGVATVARVEPYNPYRALGSQWRRFRILEKMLRLSRLFGRNVMYCAMSEILCANLDGPVVSVDTGWREPVKTAVARYLRAKKDAAYVVIMDAEKDKAGYLAAGFTAFPYCSSTWIDAGGYQSLDGYLAQHNRTRKKLARFKRRQEVRVEIRQGMLDEADKPALQKCLASSADNTRSVIPFQGFFDAHILDTEAYRSESYLHILVRLNGVLVGFTTFKRCGHHLGAILGGFDRAYTYDNPIYDLIMVTALEYALANGYDRIYFGILNNFTKARLTDSYEPLGFYFYSKFRLYRMLQRRLYFIWTPHELHQLEVRALAEKGLDGQGDK